MNNFYQSRKSQRNVEVVVLGKKVPLYGGGPSLASSPGSVATVPLSLSFMVKSRAYVLGKLVKPKFEIGVQCKVVMKPAKLNTRVSLKNSCQYYWRAYEHSPQSIQRHEAFLWLIHIIVLRGVEGSFSACKNFIWWHQLWFILVLNLIRKKRAFQSNHHKKIIDMISNKETKGIFLWPSDFQIFL